MRKFVILAAATLAGLPSVALADVAAAETASAFVPRVGQLVYSSDGKRIGNIDRVDAARVSIIADMKMVYVARSTLSAGDKGRAISSLKAAEIRK